MTGPSTSHSAVPPTRTAPPKAATATSAVFSTNVRRVGPDSVPQTSPSISSVSIRRCSRPGFGHREEHRHPHQRQSRRRDERDPWIGDVQQTPDDHRSRTDPSVDRLAPAPDPGESRLVQAFGQRLVEPRALGTRIERQAGRPEHVEDDERGKRLRDDEPDQRPGLEPGTEDEAVAVAHPIAHVAGRHFAQNHERRVARTRASGAGRS